MARGSHVGSEDGQEAEEEQNKTHVWPIERGSGSFTCR